MSVFLPLPSLQTGSEFHPAYIFSIKSPAGAYTPRINAAGAWSWPLNSILCPSSKCVILHFRLSIHQHGMVLHFAQSWINRHKGLKLQNYIFSTTHNSSSPLHALLPWNLAYHMIAGSRDKSPCILKLSESSSLLGCQSANALVSAALTRGRWPISAQNTSKDYWHKMAHVNLRGQYGPSF